MAATTAATPQKEAAAPTTEKKVDRIEKPEKPDEDAHKKEVAKLEAEHKAIMEKFVSIIVCTLTALMRHHERRLTLCRTPSAPSLTPPRPTRKDQ